MSSSAGTKRSAADASTASKKPKIVTITGNGSSGSWSVTASEEVLAACHQLHTSNSTYKVPDAINDERAARHLVHFVKEKYLLERELDDGCLVQQVLALARAVECRGLELAVADFAVEKLVAATKAKAAKVQKAKATRAANKASKAALVPNFFRHEQFLISLGCPQSVIDMDLVGEWLEGAGSPMAERYRRGY